MEADAPLDELLADLAAFATVGVALAILAIPLLLSPFILASHLLKPARASPVAFAAAVSAACVLVTLLSSLTMCVRGDWPGSVPDVDAAHDNYGALTILLPLGYVAFMGFITQPWMAWALMAAPATLLLTSLRSAAAAAVFLPFGLARCAPMTHPDPYRLYR